MLAISWLESELESPTNYSCELYNFVSVSCYGEWDFPTHTLNTHAQSINGMQAVQALLVGYVIVVVFSLVCDCGAIEFNISVLCSYVKLC